MHVAKPVLHAQTDGAYWHSSVSSPIPSEPRTIRDEQSHLTFQGARPSPVPRLLAQADSPPNLTLPQDVAIPLVVLVSPVSLPVQKVVPPPMMEPAHADVQPVLELPNRETIVSEIAVAATPINSKADSIGPSTTTPIRIRESKAEDRLPQTPSDSALPPAPATVMSISDLRMTEGTVVLPRARQSPVSSAPNAAGIGDADEAYAAADRDPGTFELRDGGGRAILIKRIHPPKNEKFGMVLVGDSLGDQYPETTDIWSGRVAYTVYMHVGLAKSWILQYSLPRTDQASGTGSSARIDAPWPTDILIPNLPAGYANSDALIVHGMLNKEGRLGKLAVVFPPEFAGARFVLDLLQQWVFRPAKQNGQFIGVEFLLIIPDQDQ